MQPVRNRHLQRLCGIRNVVAKVLHSGIVVEESVQTAYCVRCVYVCQCVLKAMAQQSIMQTCVGVFEKQWRSKASCKRVSVCFKSNGSAKHHANVCWCV